MTELTDEALYLLRFAVEHDDDTILLVADLGGSHIQIAGEELLEGLDKRKTARYLSAVRELLGGGFLEDRGGRGELLYLAGPAYDVIDLMKDRP